MALVVELVSPERVAFTGDAKMVICRTTTGDIAFLPGHVPFIGVLKSHYVRVLLEEGGEQVIAVHQGFVEVSPPEDGVTRVTILSDVCELANTIDRARAEAALAKAEAALSADPVDPEAAAAKERAEVRLAVARAVDRRSPDGGRRAPDGGRRDPNGGRRAQDGDAATVPA
jgi:F-type H+-transporting ATPase subunit epsilon